MFKNCTYLFGIFLFILFISCTGESVKSVSKENQILADSLYQKGSELLSQDDIGNALSFFERAVRLNPENHLFWLDLGATNVRLLHFEQAAAQLKYAIELNPNEVKSFFNLAVALNNLGEYQQSIGYSTQAIKLNPNFGEAYFIRGESYLFMDNDIEKLCQNCTIAYEKGCEQARGRIEQYCMKTIEIDPSKGLPPFLKFTPN